MAAPGLEHRPGQFLPWLSPFLYISNCLAEDKRQDAAPMPYPGALPKVFPWYTGPLFKILFEASFDLLQCVFHFLLITHFHFWQMGSRGPENVYNKELYRTPAVTLNTGSNYSMLEEISLNRAAWNRGYTTWAMFLTTQRFRSQCCLWCSKLWVKEVHYYIYLLVAMIFLIRRYKPL